VREFLTDIVQDSLVKKHLSGIIQEVKRIGDFGEVHEAGKISYKKLYTKKGTIPQILLSEEYLFFVFQFRFQSFL